MELSPKKIPPSSFPPNSLPEPLNPGSNPSEISGIKASIEQLVEAAETQGITIRQYPDTMNLLLRLEIAETIPQEIEALMSEILDWLGELNSQIPLRTSNNE